MATRDIRDQETDVFRNEPTFRRNAVEMSLMHDRIITQKSLGFLLAEYYSPHHATCWLLWISYYTFASAAYVRLQHSFN
ncbi:hypothetical protein Tcan_07502 [Toxocara canis]|uniref:Uncharacterized protein n=1 Tax=Toxocara canis TaxID=6265 RepID=A0A0B2VMQ4_TOXCA|nr:hypothetical protein Tcan_07502 [Toxocara canis]